MEDAPRLQDLIGLAQETSSVRRRELLRRITDLFLDEAAPPRQAVETELFDGVLTTLAQEMAQEVRVELARRFADAKSGPSRLTAQLAVDAIEVATPILANPRLLGERDLLAVAQSQGQAHLRVVSKREGLSEAVSDVIVERGDDVTLEVLLRNQTAVLSRRASETAVDRAAINPALHAAVVGRRSLPIDLLNEMYLVVQGQLRTEILSRNASADPAVLEAALTAGRSRLAARDGLLPADFAEAEAEIARDLRRGRLTPPVLAGYLRDGRRTQFALALAKMSDVDFDSVQRMLVRQDLDILAILCKAADLERALFVSLAVMISGARDALADARSFGKLYAELSCEAAQRTLRFWKVRRDAVEGAAAA